MVPTGPTSEAGVLAPAARLSIAQGVGRQADYWWTLYKRTWKGSIVSSFLSPLFYVLAMGVLLGSYVSTARLDGADSYLAFVVPGLIAAQAMTTGVQETTYPVMSAIKWNKSFYAQLATPLEARDLANAMLMFVMVRLAATCGVYFLVMAPFGVFASWWGPPLAWLVTILVGMAFGTLTFAYSAHVQSPESFGLIFRLGLIPLFLFSGAFFPITNLGTFGEWVARCTPLWHGVNLTRMLCLDNIVWSTAAINLSILVAVMVVGWWLAIRSLTARMAS